MNTLVIFKHLSNQCVITAAPNTIWQKSDHSKSHKNGLQSYEIFK